MDRWNIVTTLNYLSLEKEMEIILAKNKSYNNAEGKEKISNMIKVATLTRKGFIAGDISTVMSPRTVLHWADNAEIFKNLGYAFRVTFLNIFKKVTLNAYPKFLNISALSAQCNTVLGLITVEISPAIKPFLVKVATLIIFEIFSLPSALL